MNTAEILSKSLAWLSCREQEIPLPGQEFSDVLNLLNATASSQFAGLAIAENGEIRNFYKNGRQNSFVTFPNVTDEKPVAPEEVYFLTQVILNTLNTEPNRFHDMLDIPGLEAEAWDQLFGVAHYLITQGWIEPKATGEKLLVKLTIEGKIYLSNTNAWS